MFVLTISWSNQSETSPHILSQCCHPPEYRCTAATTCEEQIFNNFHLSHIAADMISYYITKFIEKYSVINTCQYFFVHIKGPLAVKISV